MMSPTKSPKASMVDACECCGKPGVRYFNDVWACEDCGERIERDPEADEADMRAGGGW
jgi:ribosomal protein L37AE/L43A